ncbi:sulfur carrier protein ThiS [Phytohabitans aurantiacus]|jgi:sulfur carrier protein|uniref:Thiamine biosynthesis protein ThiS n=1 Tax=Phytohabitans aurantiacus TaxID=3016789 RepID=A0ABQ5QTK2_9ACTN|nr:sulfur carrier protein ThiS [Phytohabitans aurantiacus]GLH97918.1 thiamine biosynthesis protein ThiS [Phytohabitans aurantiacus]
MNVLLNGSAHVLPDGATVAEAVAVATDRARGVAVAVNGEVVPRTGWPDAVLRDGDQIEVLTAAQGG